MGAIMMTIGSLTRCISAESPSQLSPYILQYLCILLPPSLYAASIYITPLELAASSGRRSRYQMGPSAAPISRQKVPRIPVLEWLVERGADVNAAEETQHLTHRYATVEDLMRELQKHGLAAAVINAEGELMQADAELLRARRGAGGAFGVIQSLSLRSIVFNELSRGQIAIQSDDLPEVIRQYNMGYQVLGTAGMPPELTLQQSVVNTTHGQALMVLFVWASSDIEAGMEWADKICTLAPTCGRVWTINMKRLTEEILAVITNHLVKIPGHPHTLFSLHELRTGTPSAQAEPDSVFTAREGHFVFEIICGAQEEQNLDAALAWGQGF
ncbi:uncharacterized protein BP01DRAFT_383828 [Aspergillus saccharolyticus JOP 1030-1]|uniref:Ankyrin n=1 Tax=Aspergillus saccharolyticus JOP 1030-1 TaxID=1450539 RepID=A0A318ZHI5_9EURO|nr:hypothetical protein BP01DRAFT_383828 [Aspergillus saccharolyticus JOP 1030-1]PYH44023.1 hypothetical protein BP01DRAFT_383828 [Aspergillus saccharolyticus JOP 1030-1]